MRILHVTDGIPPAVLGGSGRIAWEICTGLKERGHTTGILTAADAGAFPASRDGVDILTVPHCSQRFAHWRSVLSAARAKEVSDAIAAWKPDLVHAHVLAWQMGYKWIEKITAQGIPCIMTMHDAMVVSYGKVRGDESALWLKDMLRNQLTWNPFRNFLIRRELKHLSKILCVSDALRLYLEAHRIPTMETLRNGIDLNFWKTTMPQADARKQLSLPADAPIFLLAGRIGHDKGAGLLPSILPEGSHLLLAGEADQSAFAKLGDRLHFFSRQSAEQMRTLYAACDAALVPSIYLDPFPTICLEAMACSRPVLATMMGGAKEAIVDGVTGWIRDPCDSVAFGERLEWIAAHRSELGRFGEEAKKHVEAHFSREAFLGELTRIYEQTLE